MGSVPVPDSHVNSSVLKGLLSVHLPFFQFPRWFWGRVVVRPVVLQAFLNQRELFHFNVSGELQLFQSSRKILD